MRISTKMVLGYILVIFIPFVIFGFFSYQLYDKLMNQYLLANQQSIEQASGMLDASLSKVESLYSIFQNNAALLDYLRDVYRDDRELIYTYKKEIAPTFSFAYLAEPLVKDIVIYSKGQSRLQTITRFREYNELREQLSTDEIEFLSTTRGLWKRTGTGSDMSLHYYHKIYSKTYTTELGVLRIEIKPQVFDEAFRFLQTLHPGNDLMVVDSNGMIVVGLPHVFYSSGQIANIIREVGHSPDQALLLDKNNLLINSTHFPRLDLTFIEINEMKVLFIFNHTKHFWIAGGLFLLSLFSVLYYLIVTSLTKRILLLSRHMRKVGLDSLDNYYIGKKGNDEIGFLITNYNAMIKRIHELVHHIQKVEMVKKEANYKMLQSQIQPHFLYNTLETMRMYARKQNDDIVADMAFSLGSLLRYSLSKKDTVKLRDELENTKKYIAIHQLRMRDLEIEFYVENELLDQECPRFILQPLVENSIIHGLSKKRGRKSLIIRVFAKDRFVLIQVSDNGCGLTSERSEMLQQVLDGKLPPDTIQTMGTGLGLNNVNERIKAFYGGRSAIQICNFSDRGTTCTLMLDIKEEQHGVETDDCR